MQFITNVLDADQLKSLALTAQEATS